MIEIWGDVPDDIKDLLGEESGYLLYGEHRGPESQQEFMRGGEIVGGWVMKLVESDG